MELNKMDIAYSNQNLSKPPILLNSLSAKKNAAPLKSPAISYTEVMMREYYRLLKNLSKLDTPQFRSLQMEITSVLEKLTAWLDKKSSINAVELFSNMRHLEQKANKLLKAANA